MKKKLKISNNKNNIDHCGLLIILYPYLFLFLDI
jgi:hypothetical protein